MTEGPLRRPTAAALAGSAALACLAACGIDWTVPAAPTGAGGSSDGGGGATSEAPGSTASATSSAQPSGSTTSGDGGAPQGGTTSVTTGSDGQGAGNGDGANGGSGETVTTGGEVGCGDQGCEDCQLCAIDGGGPCREAFEACENQETCAALIDCAAGCAPEEEACIASCFEEFPEGADAADLVLSCVLCEVCSDTCGASPHC